MTNVKNFMSLFVDQKNCKINRSANYVVHEFDGFAGREWSGVC
jgi:hypothetical protein